MNRTDRRRLGRDVRKFRRFGLTKQHALAGHARAEAAWHQIRVAARPAIQHLLACIAAEQPHRQIIPNGRKPR